jgi:hypothetical protein
MTGCVPFRDPPRCDCGTSQLWQDAARARLLQGDSNLVLVHRDHLRDSFENPALDEWQVTLLMGRLASGILKLCLSPLVCAWNLDPADRELWESVAEEHEAKLEWLDVREPWVASMIPPLHAEADAR